MPFYKVKDKNGFGMFQANIEPEELKKLVIKFKGQTKKPTCKDFIKYLTKVGYCIVTMEIIEIKI